MELSNQLPGSHPLTAPVHTPERVTGPPELHHSEGRYHYLDVTRYSLAPQAPECSALRDDNCRQPGSRRYSYNVTKGLLRNASLAGVSIGLI
jgi:hypothetical protein